MKLIPLHPAQSLFASLILLSAGACLAADPAENAGSPPAPKVTTESVVVVRRAADIAAQGEASLASSSKVWCGVSLSEAPEEVKAQLPLQAGAGALIRDVVKGSPAEKAGLQANDVVTKFAGEAVTDPSQFSKLVAAKKEGDSVWLSYYRHGQEATAMVTLSKTPDAFSKMALKTDSPAPGKITIGLGIAKLSDLEQNRVTGADGNASTYILLNHDGQSFPIPGSNSAADAATIAQVEKALRDSGATSEAIERAKKDVAKALEDGQTEAREMLDQKNK